MVRHLKVKATILINKKNWIQSVQDEINSKGIRFWFDVLEWNRTPQDGIVTMYFSNQADYKKAFKLLNKMRVM